MASLCIVLCVCVCVPNYFLSLCVANDNFRPWAVCKQIKPINIVSAGFNISGFEILVTTKWCSLPTYTNLRILICTQGKNMNEVLIPSNNSKSITLGSIRIICSTTCWSQYKDLKPMQMLLFTKKIYISNNFISTQNWLILPNCMSNYGRNGQNQHKPKMFIIK